MAKPIPEKMRELFERHREPARWTGKSVAWYVARDRKFKAKWDRVRRELYARQPRPIGLEREKLLARKNRLMELARRNWSNAAAQYKWDQRQRDKAANLAFGTGPGRLYIDGRYIGPTRITINNTVNADNLRDGLGSSAGQRTILEHIRKNRERITEELNRVDSWAPYSRLYDYQKETMRAIESAFRMDFTGIEKRVLEILAAKESHQRAVARRLKESGVFTTKAFRPAFIDPRKPQRYIELFERGYFVDPLSSNLPRYHSGGYVNPCRARFDNAFNYSGEQYIPTNKKENTMSSIRLTADSIGKKFNTRDGRVAEVVYRNDNPSSPCEEFVIKVPSTMQSNLFNLRTCNSRGWANSNDDGTGRNLVSEYVPFAIKVGGIYETRDGKSRGLVVPNTSSLATYNVRWLSGLRKGTTTYAHCYQNGRLNAGPRNEHTDDLVKFADASFEERAAAEAILLAEKLLNGTEKVVEAGREADTRELRNYYNQTCHQLVTGYTTTFKGRGFSLTVQS